jgi:surface protein
MTGMFKGAAAFNRDISGWNTASVSSVASMFSGATSFNQNIARWNVRSVHVACVDFRLNNTNGMTVCRHGASPASLISTEHSPARCYQIATSAPSTRAGAPRSKKGTQLGEV